MTKFLSTVMILVLALAALGAVSARLTEIIGALVPLVLVVGVVVAVLRLTWWYTRH